MQKPQIIRAYIEKAAIFEGISERELFVPYLDVLIFTDGETIMSQGDYGNDLFFLVQGGIRIIATYKDYSDKVAVVSDKGVIGEITFTTKYGHRTASVVAETNCVMLRLARDRFDQFRVKHPDAANQFMLLLAEIMGGKLAKTTATLVSVERKLYSIGKDYGVDDFSEILERIDSSLSEIVGADKFEPGSFVAPPT